MTDPGIDALWDYGDPVGSEARFREALERVEERDRAAELKTQIARALTLQRRYEEASQVLKEIEQILDEVPLRVRVRCRLERSRWLNDKGRTEAAFEVSEEAFHLALPDPELIGFAVDAAHMLGYFASPSVAVVWNARALEMARASEDPAARRWVGRLWSNQGHKMLALERYEDALECFARTQAERERSGDVVGARHARCDRARTWRLMGRVAEARELQVELHVEFDRDGVPDGYVLEELGECDLLLGDTDVASGHFARAYAILSRDPWFPPTASQRLERLRRLGRIHPGD